MINVIELKIFDVNDALAWVALDGFEWNGGDVFSGGSDDGKLGSHARAESVFGIIHEENRVNGAAGRVGVSAKTNEFSFEDLFLQGGDADAGESSYREFARFLLGDARHGPDLAQIENVHELVFGADRFAESHMAFGHDTR